MDRIAFAEGPDDVTTVTDGNFASLELRIQLGASGCFDGTQVGANHALGRSGESSQDPRQRLDMT